MPLSPAAASPPLAMVCHAAPALLEAMDSRQLAVLSCCSRSLRDAAAQPWHWQARAAQTFSHALPPDLLRSEQPLQRRHATAAGTMPLAKALVRGYDLLEADTKRLGVAEHGGDNRHFVVLARRYLQRYAPQVLAAQAQRHAAHLCRLQAKQKDQIDALSLSAAERAAAQRSSRERLTELNDSNREVACASHTIAYLGEPNSRPPILAPRPPAGFDFLRKTLRRTFSAPR